MKVCSVCKEEKEEASFPKTGAYCKSCRAAYHRNYYHKHKHGTGSYCLEKRREIRNRSRTKKRDYVKELFKSGCTDCGITDPLVLEFDHLRDKELNIARILGSYYSLERLKAEIAKCEIVCANCHRRRTANRAGNWWCNT